MRYPNVTFFIFRFSEYELPSSTHKKIPAEVYKKFYRGNKTCRLIWK